MEQEKAGGDLDRGHDQEMAALGERMKHAIRAAGGAPALAVKIPMAIAQLYRYSAGSSEPSLRKAAAISKLAGVSLNWLADGVGSVQEVGLVTLPVYDLVDGEFAQVGVDRSVLAMSTAALKGVSENHADLIVHTLRGDTGGRDLPDGSLVVLEKSDGGAVVAGTYLVKVGSQVMAVMLQAMPGSAIKARPLSQDYDAFEFHVGQGVQVLGRVRWGGRHF